MESHECAELGDKEQHMATLGIILLAQFIGKHKCRPESQPCRKGGIDELPPQREMFKACDSGPSK